MVVSWLAGWKFSVSIYSLNTNNQYSNEKHRIRNKGKKFRQSVDLASSSCNLIHEQTHAHIYIYIYIHKCIQRERVSKPMTLIKFSLALSLLFLLLDWFTSRSETTFLGTTLQWNFSTTLLPLVWEDRKMTENEPTFETMAKERTIAQIFGWKLNKMLKLTRNQ